MSNEIPASVFVVLQVWKTASCFAVSLPLNRAPCVAFPGEPNLLVQSCFLAIPENTTVWLNIEGPKTGVADVPSIRRIMNE